MNELVFIESEIKMPLMALPVRSVYVNLGDKGILISPGSKISVDQYRQLSNVTDIVAPNLFHTGGIPKAQSTFKNARIWGPEGAKNKKPEIQWSHSLVTQSWPFENELRMVPIAGMPKINEVVFYHPVTKSIIVADLAFNMNDLSGWGPRLILGLFGTYKKFGVSRFFLKFIEDKTAFKNSIALLLSLDFDKIIVSHGNNLLNHGKASLLSALAERGIRL